MFDEEHFHCLYYKGKAAFNTAGPGKVIRNSQKELIAEKIHGCALYVVGVQVFHACRVKSVFFIFFSVGNKPCECIQICTCYCILFKRARRLI